MGLGCPSIGFYWFLLLFSGGFVMVPDDSFLLFCMGVTVWGDPFDGLAVLLLFFVPARLSSRDPRPMGPYEDPKFI